MALQNKLEQAAAAQAADIARRYGGNEGYDFGRVCTVVEILTPHGSDTAIGSPEGLSEPAPILDLLRKAVAALEAIQSGEAKVLQE